MATTFRNVYTYIMKHRFLRNGIPFVIFVAGGSFYLKQFASIRYEFRNAKRMTPEEAEAKGLKIVDVDETCKEILKEIEEKDLDNWQNIRGPRPWEDSKEFQEQERQKLKTS